VFTIIIPTHDRPVLLQRTLESLIGQTCQEFKLVIVSDSATYVPPYQQLAHFGGRFDYVLRCSGRPGPAHSRDLGQSIASGEYLIFLDDDDTFQPDHLAQLQARLEIDRPEMLFCDLQVQFENRAVSPPELLGPTHKVSIADVTDDSVYVRNRIPNSCIAYRRDVLEGIRNNPDMIIYEDWDFLLSALNGRTLTYLATDGVVIHKTDPNAPENMRRGNSNEGLVVEVMLELYQRHPARNMATRLARQALLASVNLHYELAYF
jgi:glycosyltransferase involved in cell wall biosynthesis